MKESVGMEHLSVRKIIKFISFDEITKETLDLALEVNSHISECAVCREKIRSIQGILDRMLDYEPPGSDSFQDVVLDPEIREEIAKFYGKS